MTTDALSPPVLLGQAALFLDFDGTLVPLAPRPQDIQVPSWVVPVLDRLRLQLGGALAVVSGRPLAQIDAFLHPLRLPGAGVHGVERRLIDGRVRVHAGMPPAAVLQAAQSLVELHPELMLERKPGGLALHYRGQPQLASLCRRTLESVVAEHDDWDVMPGDCVVEVKQSRVSKGAALRAFLAEPAFIGRVPVYVGDDVSDEDGIRQAQASGGFGVKVGGNSSLAQYRLPDPQAVGRWLVVSAEAMQPFKESA